MTLTESITKALRLEKGSTPSESFIRTANDLLTGNLDVYFPNRTQFLYDLLSERLAFAQWKTDPRVWNLFHDVWLELTKNLATSKHKMARKFKLVDILTSAFDTKLSGSQVSELWKPMFAVVDTFIKETFIDIDESQSIILLSRYLQSLSGIILDIDPSVVNNSTSSIRFLFQLPRLQITFKQNKKHVTKFCIECLDEALHLISLASKDDRLSPFKNIVETILTDVLLDEDIKNILKQNIVLAIKKIDDSRINDSLAILFILIIDNLCNKDIQLCEEILKAIVETKSANELNDVLIERLSSVNRALSHDFFQSIYQVSKSNWILISRLIELDAEIGIKNYEDIMIAERNKATFQKNDKLLVGGKIADAFIRSREFETFILNVWPKAIKADKFWKSSEFTDLLSTKVNEFSSNQIAKILTPIFSGDELMSNIPLVNAIVKGLIDSPDSKIEPLKSLLLKNHQIYSGESDDLWELKYSLLCLFGEVAFTENEKAIRKSLKSNSSSKFYYYSVFRIFEVTAIDDLEIPSQESFLKNLHNFASTEEEHTEILDVMMGRWIVVINNFFDEKSIRLLLEFMFNKNGVHFLENMKHYDVVFEQSKFVNTLISYLLEDLTNSRDKNYVRVSECILLIPIQCFHKREKKEFIEFITERCLSDEKYNNEVTKKALYHLLKNSPNNTSIELDFQKLNILFKEVKISERENSEANKISSEICTLILLNHLSQVNAKEHEEYLISGLKSLNEYFKRLEAPEVTQKYLIPKELFVSCCILSTRSTQLEKDHVFQIERTKLLGYFIPYLCNLLESSKNYAQLNRVELNQDFLNWCMDSIYFFIDSDVARTHNLHKLITSLKNQAEYHVEKGDIRMQRNLFKITFKITTPTLENAISIVNNYCTISNDDVRSACLPALSDYLTKLSQDNEVFESFFKFIIFAANQVLDPNHPEFLLNVITILIRLLKKKHQESHTRLFSQSLSLILNKFQLIESSSVNKAASPFFTLLNVLKQSLSDMIWLFNQYAIELVINLTNKVQGHIKSFKSEIASDLFILLSQVFSHILMFHRFRLSSRHHLIIKVLTTMLEQLSLKDYKISTKFNLSLSVSAATAYSRLLSNLCEPTSHNLYRELAESSLSSASALIKKSLRQHLHILLINYIHFQLKYNFDSKVNAELLRGIYNIFDVLSKKELQLVSFSLDSSGKTYYKTLYANYKDYGKWKDN